MEIRKSSASEEKTGLTAICSQARCVYYLRAEREGNWKRNREGKEVERGSSSPRNRAECRKSNTGKDNAAAASQTVVVACQ